MRTAMFVILLGTAGWAQSLVEASAAAAGGSVGGVAGKKVSDGLTKIFEKVDKQTAKAAKQGAPSKPKPSADDAPLFDVGPGVPKSDTFVPPPPPPALPVAAHSDLAPPLRSLLQSRRRPFLPPPPPCLPEVTAPDLTPCAHSLPRGQELGASGRSEGGAGTAGFATSPAVRRTGTRAGDLSLHGQGTPTIEAWFRLSDGRVSSIQMP